LAENLAEKLDYTKHGAECPQTLASCGYMRDQRIRVVGGMWKLSKSSEFGAPSVFTAIARGLEIPGKALNSINPQSICAAFRSDLNRSGAVEANGYLIAFLDGEYEPNTDVWRLHFHGLVAGEMRHVMGWTPPVFRAP